MGEMFEHKNSDGLTALPISESLAVDATSARWQDCGADGFSIKSLLEDETAGIRTWLMKVDAGAFSPMHAHDEVEQIYVLEGSFYDQHKTYGPGEYIVRAAGAMHSAGSKAGAVVMLFYSPAPSSSP
ncbi:MAG: anti-sigma factor ChrR (cupin superfamily) [Planctomycetota bacterium]|jgi:anti-sigma factor ChrR (cupin superfamily)